MKITFWHVLLIFSATLETFVIGSDKDFLLVVAVFVVIFSAVIVFVVIVSVVIGGVVVFALISSLM